ncbi:short-chain dehydrogenase [Aneurinibacillus migulanus]|uniref:SDR family NAD(P)-dependent oxidoreductase n=1 Tax=Aneurinibacillus migulanus TaxID=47500 RepID=UPI0005B93E07|nr:SDR family NAD(P)-dependent oxidoreductase [Aneurinibacillus migulanus]KIV56818.1 short-chain dehydrogenase [Aneurinibacillus migulanus]KPD08590.1 short-chain dehydrogenase [Aneurinibacillus migulanus]CEH28987.1 SDR family short chain dehydrogenase/reductase [Aneurinibacillus migulanus]
MKNIIVFGASKGLGDALVKGLPEPGDNVWIVSRSRPDSLLINDGVYRSWIQADLSLLTASSEIADVLENETIDVLVYNVGIWEKEGFQDHYDFEQDDPTDIANLIQVNITSAITCIQKLLPHMKNSDNGKIFLIGSTAGLENTNHSQVSFVASKFGLRGIGNALREHVRKYSIGVTCINPGELAAEIPYEDGAEKAIDAYNGTRIPVQDIVSLVKCVANLSKVSCVKEIHIPAISDLNA